MLATAAYGVGGTPPAQLRAETFRDGDLVFQESRSAQSVAIAEVQRSSFTHVGLLFERRGRWEVLEAHGPVGWTPLSRFLRRGGRVRVMRLSDGLTGEQAARLRRAAEAFAGRPYDTRFEWSDARIYCSELASKAYERGLGVDLGGRQDWAELPLDGPAARALLRARGGRPRGAIVTPASLLASSALVEVARGP